MRCIINKYFFVLFVFSMMFIGTAQAKILHDIDFDVYMNDSFLGTHKLVVTQFPNGHKQVDIAIDFRVTFGFIPVYRYTHRNTEIWDSRGLLSAKTTTDNNGEYLKVEARRTPDGLLVKTGQGTTEIMPQPIYSTSYWQRNTMYQTELLNTQEGDLINVSTSRLKKVPEIYKDLDCYNVTGDLQAILCYNPSNNEWAGLEFVRSGRTIHYVRKNQSE